MKKRAQSNWTETSRPKCLSAKMTHDRSCSSVLRVLPGFATNHLGETLQTPQQLLLNPPSDPTPHHTHTHTHTQTHTLQSGHTNIFSSPSSPPFQAFPPAILPAYLSPSLFTWTTSTHSTGLILGLELAHYSPKAKSGPPLVFVGLPWQLSW